MPKTNDDSTVRLVLDDRERTHTEDGQKYIQQFYQYVHGCLDGLLPSNRWVKAACKRHLSELRDSRWVFDEQKAIEACAFFEHGLRHSKGEFAGKPFLLTRSETFFICSIFGWTRASDGMRKYTRAMCKVARKWGKSEIASGCALKVGSLDSPFEPGAEVYLVATKEEQVRDTTYKQCTRMVDKSPFLNQRMHCKVKAIITPPDDPFQPNSVIKPIGSDSATSDGFDLSAAVLDELHAWQRKHHELYEKMTTAGGARRQELILMFTTEGNDESELLISLNKQCENMLKQIERGETEVAHHLFAYLASIDEDDDILSMTPGSVEFERTIRKSCPNYPITPKQAWVHQRHADAKNDPLEANKFLRFVGNTRVTAGLKPISTAMWESAQTLLGEHQYPTRGAIDAGRNDDFAAFCVMWKVGKEYHAKVRSYTVAERPKNMKTNQIAEYIEDNSLIEHPGNQIDFDALEDDICSTPDVLEWAYDPIYLSQMSQHLQARLGEEVPVKFPQHHRHYNEACRLLTRLLKDRLLKVDVDDRCLAWQASNLAYKPNAREEYMPDKRLSREFKIDGMVALIMALKLHMQADVVEVEPAIAIL